MGDLYPTKLTENERLVFFGWLDDVYGYGASQNYILASDEQITGTELFRYWLQAGRPKTGVPQQQQPQPLGQQYTAYPSVDVSGGATIPGMRSGEPQLPVVQSYGGYDWQWIADGTGGGYWELIGQTPTPETISPYQKELLMMQRIEQGQRQAEIMNQQAGNVSANRANLYQQIANEQSGLRQGDVRALELQAQQKMADEFEKWRREFLTTYAPRDWIIAEQLRNTPNPFARTEDIGVAIRGYREEVAGAKRDLQDAKQKFSDMSKRVTDSADIVQGQELMKYKDEYDAAKFRYDTLQEQLKSSEKVLARAEASPEAAWAKPRPVAGGNFEVGAPEAPREKPVVRVPGELQKEFGITSINQRFETPSMQQLTGSTYAGREQLAGFAAYRGQNWQDILNRIQVSLPQNPRFKRRTVARQWA